MHKFLFVLFLFAFPGQTWSQVLPREGSRLHYRLIGFSFPVVSTASSYRVEIAKGYYNNADSFKKMIIASADAKTNRVIAEVPAFGCQYTWRTVTTGKKNVEGSLYHFTTRLNQHIDTTKLRMRVLQPAAEQYKDDYVAVDGGGILYDMKGNAVWYIPDTNGYGGNVANLEFTPDGTMTFIYREAFEINYSGDVLWRTPAKGVLMDTSHGELYHHEFTKLANGHFMTLGMQVLMCKTIKEKDTSYIVAYEDKEKMEKNGFKLGRFGGIIEYDENGKIVWLWKSSKYLLEADLAYFNPADSNTRYDPHDNAFFFDQKNKVIYLGFRNLNRIIKIEYPGGRVLNTYGEIFKPGVKGIGEKLFCNQHSIGLTQDGYLYYFNNNSCVSDAAPTVVMLKEPDRSGDPLKKVWEYTCTIDGKYENFASGGNAIELPDRSLFVNMGSKYSKLFIVNRDKKILWSALPERYVETDRKWVPMHEYRANIITRKELERVIWTAETGKTTR